MTLNGVIQMPAIAAIVLNDGKATPVAHTFSPKKQVGDITTWEDRAGGVPKAYPRLSFLTKESDVLRRVSAVVQVPVLKAVAGVNSLGYTPAAEVAHTLKFKIEGELPQLSSKADRADIYALVSNLFADPNVKKVFVDGDEFFG